MFSSSYPKLFAVRNIHYPVNTSGDHFHTDAVVPSSDHCCTQAVLPPSGHCCIGTVSPSGDHDFIDIIMPSSDHCCTETVSPSSDHYGTTKVAPPSDHLQYNTIQYNTIKFISTFIHVNNYYNTFKKNEKSKRICRKLNKLIRDIPRITHNQFT